MKTRVETKKIQRTETITETKYIAFDGTEFDKENDCFIYEADQILKRDDIIVFDNLKNCSIGFIDPYNNYRFVYLMPTTQEAAELVEEYWSDGSKINPNEIYCFKIGYDDDVWVYEIKDIIENVIAFFKELNMDVEIKERR